MIICYHFDIKNVSDHSSTIIRKYTLNCFCTPAVCYCFRSLSHFLHHVNLLYGEYSIYVILDFPFFMPTSRFCHFSVHSVHSNKMVPRPRQICRNPMISKRKRTEWFNRGTPSQCLVGNPSYYIVHLCEATTKNNTAAHSPTI